jgi:chromatin structure-remodeling complex protein RSC7
MLTRHADREDTQPTRSRWESMGDKKPTEVLGGSRVGAGAWGLAWVDTMIELPQNDEEAKQEEARIKTVSRLEPT